MGISTQKELPNIEVLQAEAASFAHTLAPHADRAILVTLSGELGAGKTSYTQGMAGALGITDPITSPTFVLEKVYELSERPFARLIHIDAYRLEGENSLVPLNFSELYKDPANLIVLEWPEIVVSQLPQADHQVKLAVSGEGRTISYA